MSDVFNREAAADYLRVHPETITRMCARGMLRYAKFGRALRIRREWCDQMLEDRAVGPTSEDLPDSVLAGVFDAQKGA